MTRGKHVLLALAAATLAACSETRAGSLPPPAPPPTTSATLSATPSATASADPADSVRAALRRYFDALYAAGLDPANKTDELELLIHPSCTCMRTVEVLREEARLGRYIDYRYTLRDVQVVEVGRQNAYVRYTVARSAGAERDTSWRVVEKYPAAVERYSVRFRRVDGTWLLDRVARFR